MNVPESGLKRTDMQEMNFNQLLLKTAFSCMACDGDIDVREVDLIRYLHQRNKTFGEIDINTELDLLLVEINKDGHQFLKDFFKELKSSKLSNLEELKLIEVAIATIKADDKIEYSEIKFFKIIRSSLQISDEMILKEHPDFEDYLEQDVFSKSFLSSFQDDYFDLQAFPQFEMISSIDDNTFKRIGDKK